MTLGIDKKFLPEVLQRVPLFKAPGKFLRIVDGTKFGLMLLVNPHIGRITFVARFKCRQKFIDGSGGVRPSIDIRCGKSGGNSEPSRRQKMHTTRSHSALSTICFWKVSCAP